MIGPSIVPMPQIAIAWPCRSGGFESQQHRLRQRHQRRAANPLQQAVEHQLQAGSVAAPHRAEAMVKPITEAKNTHLMPNRPASQPVSGVMIAAATM